jgi:hypothetical protein
MTNVQGAMTTEFPMTKLPGVGCAALRLLAIWLSRGEISMQGGEGPQ